MRSQSIRFALALGLSLVSGWLVAACELSDDDDAGDSGEERLEFIARIDQNGPEFVIYGYVTAANEIPAERLFAEGTPPAERGPQAARVTFYGTASITARSIIENIFNVSSRGSVTFYYQEQGADFADPASFQQGEQVAVTDISFQNVITVTAPNTGISNGTGTMTFTDIEEFSSGGEEYELAGEDERQRVTMVGSGTRIEPEPPQAMIHVAGNTVAISSD